MPVRSLTLRYMLALSLLAGLAVWGQVLVQRQLAQSQHDAWLVNNAGRQRFQSQLLVKNVLLLTAPRPQVNPDRVVQTLRQERTNWATVHAQLQQGRRGPGGEITPNSDTVRQLYARIQPHFDTILAGTDTLLTLTDRTGPAAQRALAQVLTHEQPFLTQMDGLVGQYQGEAEARVAALRQLEETLLLGTLLVLLLEALLIFYPVTRVLSRVFGRVAATQQETNQTLAELRATNQALHQTQEQLLAETTLRHQQQLREQRIQMASLVQGQEEERRRLSYALHDGTGQMLTGLKLLTENLPSIHLLPAAEQRTQQTIKSLVISVIQETRRIATNLMPPVLSDFGLEPALRHLADQTSQTAQPPGLRVRVTAAGATDVRLEPGLEIGLYRVVQEALTNTLKHANATEVGIDLRLEDNRLVLSVADNGQGIGDAQTEAVLVGQGLHHMRQRTRLMNGVMRLISQPGQGTRIEITIALDGSPEEALPLSLIEKP